MKQRSVGTLMLAFDPSRSGLAATMLTVVLACAGCNKSGAQGAKKSDAPAPVAVTAVRRGSVSAVSTGAGEVLAAQEVKLTSQIEGTVRAVHASVGSNVAARQPVIELDCRLTQSEIAEAEAALGRSSAEAARAERLVDAGLGEERRLEAATAQERMDRARTEHLRTRLGFCRFASPFAGVVTARTVYAGDLARPGTHLATIADVSRLRVVIPLPEREAAFLKAGSPVDVRIDALGDRKHDAKVAQVWPAADPLTHKVNVEIDLGAVWPEVKPGYMARATFELARRDGALLIDRRALLRGAQGDSGDVFVLEGDVARKRRVRLGLGSTDTLEVVGGVREGEQVVIRGAESLNDGARVRIEPAAADAGVSP